MTAAHLAIASTHEGDALRAIQFSDGKPVEVAAAALAQAQVSATLALVHTTAALVEQQRIANLIALFGMPDNDAHDLSKLGLNWLDVGQQLAAEFKS